LLLAAYLLLLPTSYFLLPTSFFLRCVLHPFNPMMLRAHLAAAAREHPLRLPPPLDPSPPPPAAAAAAAAAAVAAAPLAATPLSAAPPTTTTAAAPPTTAASPTTAAGTAPAALPAAVLHEEAELRSGEEPEPELGPWARWSGAAQLALRGGELGAPRTLQLTAYILQLTSYS
jgi:hypothetical protein